MTADEERSLSLAEWLVLSLVCEEPRHGFAIARILDREGLEQAACEDYRQTVEEYDMTFRSAG